jgi:hypothetical protein
MIKRSSLLLVPHFSDHYVHLPKKERFFTLFRMTLDGVMILISSTVILSASEGSQVNVRDLESSESLPLLYLVPFVLFQEYFGQLVLQRRVLSLKQLVQLLWILEFDLVTAHVFRHQGSIDKIGRTVVMLF